MKLDRALPLASVTLAVISFFWISLRSNWERLRRVNNSQSSWWKRACVTLWELLPYILGAVALSYLGVATLIRTELDLKDHVLRVVRSADEEVDMEGRTIVDIRSTQEHFEITIEGGFVGPVLRQLSTRFGSLDTVRVYTVVVEESRPAIRRLRWVQTNEYGLLGLRGHYVTRAFLGGMGRDTAREGELFSVRIYIPAEPAQSFPEYAVYDDERPLPKVLFLSEPFYIRTHRPRSIQG